MAYPPPVKVVPSISFHQNDRKVYPIDHLYGVGHFPFGFHAAGCHPLGWSHSLNRRGLSYIFLNCKHSLMIRCALNAHYFHITQRQRHFKTICNA